MCHIAFVVFRLRMSGQNIQNKTKQKRGTVWLFFVHASFGDAVRKPPVSSSINDKAKKQAKHSLQMFIRTREALAPKPARSSY